MMKTEGNRLQFFVGEVAERLNVSIHTLRYYEKEGLVPDLRRDSGGRRVYSESDVQWIYMIRCLRDIDMPVRDIRTYVELYRQGAKTIPEREKMLAGYLILVEERITLYQGISAMLGKKLQFYHEMTAGLMNGEEPKSDACGDYFNEWESFKGFLKGGSNE